MAGIEVQCPMIAKFSSAGRLLRARYHSKAWVRFPFRFSSILHHIRDKATYWSKIVIFSYPMHSTSPLGVPVGILPFSAFMVSVQPISATSAYPLLPSQVVSICDLQRLALYWFHAPDYSWTTKFRSQRTSHIRLSPALRSLDLSESASNRALKTHLFSTARLNDVFMILAPDI